MIMGMNLPEAREIFENNWNYSVCDFSPLGGGQGTSGTNYKVKTAKNGTWVLRFPGSVGDHSFNNAIYALTQVAVIKELYESEFRYDVPFIQPTNSGDYPGSHVLSLNNSQNIILYLNQFLKKTTIPEDSVITRKLASSIGEMMSAFHNSVSGICQSNKTVILNGETYPYSEILKPENTLSNILDPDNATRTINLIEENRNNYSQEIYKSFQQLNSCLMKFHNPVDENIQRLVREYQEEINIPEKWIANHNDWQPNNLMWNYKTHKLTGIAGLAHLIFKMLVGHWQPNNLMWNDKTHKLTGIIDFGTLAIGPRIIDIANAVKFIWGIFGNTDMALMEAFFQGYNDETKHNQMSMITNTERQLLPYVILDNISQKSWYSFERYNQGNSSSRDEMIIKRESELIPSVISLIEN